MPLDYSNPLTIAFLKESYDKENLDRVFWFSKNKEAIIKRSTFSDHVTNYTQKDVKKALVELGMPSISAHHKISGAYRRRKLPSDGPILGVSEHKTSARKIGVSKELLSSSMVDIENVLLSNTKMKPVDPKVMGVLYTELPEGGRRVYLKKRQRTIPEDKFYFCETSNNVIGWRLSDSTTSSLGRNYKRFSYLDHDMKSRSGPQADPPHYLTPIQVNKNNCSI